MSETRNQSTSMYLTEMKAVATTGIKSCYDTLLQYCSVVKSVPEIVGLRLDNRTSSQFGKQLKNLQPQPTNNEDVYIMDMGTMSAGSMNYISAIKIANSQFCVSDETGMVLYQAIVDTLHGGKRVFVSFRNITEISSAFLESAIGRLYQSGFTEDEIEKRVIIRGLSEDDKFILEMVLDRVKDFLKDPYYFELNMNNVLGEDND